MSIYSLNANGYFYANGSVVKLTKRPAGVIRYIIYSEVEKPTIVSFPKDYYDMKNGEILEVVTDRLERIFFAYNDNHFVQKYFEPIDILEGEHELLKHLGLLGMNRVEHYNEIYID